MTGVVTGMVSLLTGVVTGMRERESTRRKKETLLTIKTEYIQPVNSDRCLFFCTNTLLNTSLRAVTPPILVFHPLAAFSPLLTADTVFVRAHRHRMIILCLWSLFHVCGQRAPEKPQKKNW